jgi:lipoprotein-anchoring transpeptidase ErfK/SrfK
MKIVRFAAVALLVAAVGCSKQETKNAAGSVKDAATNVKDKVVDTLDDIGVPIETKAERAQAQAEQAARAQQRFDERWRKLRSFQAAQQKQAADQAAQQVQAQAAAQQAAAAQAAAAQAPAGITFATTPFKETFKKTDPATFAAMPVHVPIRGDVAGPSVLRAQVLLDRLDLSVGPLDGRWGKNSAIAVYRFQQANGLPPTGDVDQATFSVLASRGASATPVVRYTIAAADTKGPFVTIPEDVYDKEKLSCLCYESLGEELAEKFHTTQEFLETLNPDTKLVTAGEGTQIWVPNVRPPRGDGAPDIASIRVSISGNSFDAFDAAGNLVFHAPTTVGNKYDPSPNETVKIVATSHNPHFHYQPTLFHEVPDSDPEANLQPGPNSPVGVVWMALSKPHFGIHGTGDPDSIGYASSHGCVRLTNWDADEVSRRVSKGTPVEFVDTRKESQE